jgi:hypothetical protein
MRRCGRARAFRSWKAPSSASTWAGAYPPPTTTPSAPRATTVPHEFLVLHLYPPSNTLPNCMPIHIFLFHPSPPIPSILPIPHTSCIIDNNVKDDTIREGTRPLPRRTTSKTLHFLPQTTQQGHLTDTAAVGLSVQSGVGYSRVGQ